MMGLHPLFWTAPVGAIAALAMAYVFFRLMVASNPGNARMIEIAGYVREGAMAYLSRQYAVVGKVFVGLTIILGVLAYFDLQSPLVPIAFLTGGFFSGLCGYLGMQTATLASNRTAQGARESLDRGLKVAFRSGAVMGLIVVGFALIDIVAWFVALKYLANPANGFVVGENVFLLGINLGHLDLAEITVIMLNFGMGASTQALFARVGGGIFTKAADVGADLVGKVEAGIPEDDPRNPATIADNVGDNVGDVAGMGADLYESFAGSILATAALGAAAFHGDFQLQSVLAPMAIAGIGTIASILGIFLVKTKEGATQAELMGALNRGIVGASILAAIGAAFVVKAMLPGHFGLFGSILAGLAAGLIIGKATEYYTSDDFAPTQWIASQCKTGPATTIIGGMAVGMESTMIPVITISIGTILAYAFGGGFTPGQGPSFGLYGVGIAAVGMLSTLGITLATDAYGPIADNAGGNAEMSHLDPEVRKRTDALDSLGNTTAATGKGFAIGSAALTALALIAAYIEEIRIGLLRVAASSVDGLAAVGSGVERFNAAQIKALSVNDFMAIYDVTLMNPAVLVGLFIGAMMAFYFCALTMKAVGRSASAIVDEVRRQFKEIPGLLDGKKGVVADYARCVALCTTAAQKEMIFPSLLAIATPVIVGILFDVAGVIGLLAGGLSTGFVLAIMMANAGGAWDNAKKFIEKGNHGGKGSNAHKAGVVGDTVGDPFKDTSGPSLNILIKLMAMVSIVFAGVIAKYPPAIKYIPAIFQFFGL